MKALPRGTVHGLLFLIVLTLLVHALSLVPFLHDLRLSPMVLGVIVGMILANTVRSKFPKSWDGGLKIASKQILRAGIVLYGFRLSFDTLLAVRERIFAYPLSVFRDFSKRGDFVQKFGAHRVGVVFATTNTGVQENYAEFFACNKGAGNFISQDGENSALGRGIFTPNGENFAKISKDASDKFKNFCFERNSHANPANFIRERFGLKSVAIGVSSACTSGNKALIEASRLIYAGLCDAVVFGGADALDELTLQGFSALEILSKQPLKPFSDPFIRSRFRSNPSTFIPNHLRKGETS